MDGGMVNQRARAPAESMGEGTAQEVAAGRRHIIRRPRLTRLLDECDARIILLVAPAGYGKTTLAREWATAPRRYVWVDVRPYVADVAALAASLSAAVGNVVASAGRGVIDRLRASAAPSPSPDVLAELLAADVVHWPSDTWLVIDDYHYVEGSADAQTFIDCLSRISQLNMLILSRTRPNWATPRRLLYGEVFELGATELAMNNDEASAVLTATRRTSPPGLVALAEGWPAVIGLAALRPRESVPRDEIPAELYDFFAEEVYRGLSEEARVAVSNLAAAPTITDEVAVVVLGDRAHQILPEILTAGLLAKRNTDYEFHPLLRDFIKRRVATPADSASLRRLIDFHLARREWDEAFEIAVTTHDAGLANFVIEGALDDLLNVGRLETLRSWTTNAPSGIDPALLELVEAQLAFRHAQHEQAFVLASRAARAIGSKHPLGARANLSAGQAAYFSDRTTEGKRYSDAAVRLAQSAEERADALWLRFTASTELEDPTLPRLLTDFEESRSDRPDDVVRAVCGHLILDIRFGEDPHAPRHAEGARGLLDRVEDPIIRASFFNLLGRSLVLRSHYEEATALFTAGEDVATQTRLDFALPHLLMAHALAELGRGRLWRAQELLARAGQYTHDPHTVGNERLIRGKILLAEHRFDDAARAFAEQRGDVSDRATLAELFAYGGLAAAASARHRDARALADQARQVSRTIEPDVIANVASALAAVSRDEAVDLATRAASRVAAAGHSDLLVLPLRVAPAVRDLLGESPVAGTAPLMSALAHAERPRDHAQFASLSKREREVLTLVAEGLSNKQIGRQLFISDVTVKVHVRHILEKLGVRTRTEAAVLAVEWMRYAAGASDAT